MTGKVVIVEKMLFEDSLVCHDPPSARISPLNDGLPPPCRSTAGMRVLSARFCLVEVQNHARWAYRSRADFGNYVSRPCQLVAASSKQDAPDTVKWLTVPDVHGDRSTTTADYVLLSQFLFLHLVVVASSLPALSSGSLLLSERMTVSVSFSRQSQTGVLQLLEQFFYWFSVWRRRRRSAWSWRSTVGGSFFFLSSPLELPAIRLEGILLLTPILVGLSLQYTRNLQQPGRKRKRSSTHRRSPATNKVVEILILGTYLLLDRSFDYLRASPSNSRDTPLWSYDFAFLEKSLKNEENYLLIETRDRRQKNKPTFLESIWLCHVASHTAAQQTILPTWLDNVVSRIDVAAAASISRHAWHPCFSSRHMQSWTWRQNQSARNLIISAVPPSGFRGIFDDQ